MMKVGVAADHGGFTLKKELKALIDSGKFEIIDFGAESYEKTDDYPDKILPLAKAISNGEVDKGIAICGSGVGASIVANKLPGVRAALITESYSAHQGVEHDHMNVLCLGGRVVGTAIAAEIIHAFLQAEFAGDERFQRRLNKLNDIEKSHLK